MLEIVRLASLVTIEPVRIFIRFLSSPLEIFRIVPDVSIGSTLALAFWAAAFNRHMASIQAEGVSLFFRGVRDSPQFFSVVSQPFIGEFLTLLNITIFLFLAVPMFRLWSGSWAEALNDKNALRLILILFGISFAVRGMVQVPAAIIVETSETISQSAFKFLRVSTMLGGVAQLIMLLIIVVNLRKLRSDISAFKFFLGTLIWLVSSFLVVGLLFRFLVRYL